MEREENTLPKAFIKALSKEGSDSLAATLRSTMARNMKGNGKTICKLKESSLSMKAHSILGMKALSSLDFSMDKESFISKTKNANKV